MYIIIIINFAVIVNYCNNAVFLAGKKDIGFSNASYSAKCDFICGFIIICNYADLGLQLAKPYGRG